MTRMPPGPPPGAAGVRPRDPQPSDSQRRGPQDPSRQAALGYPPLYPPGQMPLPPRRRQTRSSPVVAPLLALIGLLIVGGASIWGVTLLGVDLADFGAAQASPTPIAGQVAEASAVPDPSALPISQVLEPEATELPEIVKPPPDQRANVRGTIVFSRAGDIWTASGLDLRRLTNSDSTKADSGPTWSPDGKQIYFIRTTKRPTSDSRRGGLYTLYVTDVWRMKADGSERKRVYDSLIKDAAGTWFSYVLQPDVSPDGITVAVVSDGPDGEGPVELHVLNSRTGRISKVATPSEGELGHNDPDFSPDGRRIAFTYNSAKGADGVPQIAIHTCRTPSNCTLGSTKLLRLGYAHPSWSPDGTWLAAEATRGSGRDIVIIEPRRGDVRVVLTTDGDSFSPVVSPDGDQIAYLHRDGLRIDVRVMTLDIDETGKITLIEDRPVTDDGSIDGESPPEWFMPADQLTPRDSPPSGVADEAASAAPASAAPASAAPSQGVPAPPGS